MKAKSLLLLIVFCGLLLSPRSGLAEENGITEDGESLYVKKFCVTCHGEKGISPYPNYPNLANQNPQYLVNQVKDIIAGKRTTKLTLLMTDNPVVVKTTDAEIQAIAEYLNQVQGE